MSAWSAAGRVAGRAGLVAGLLLAGAAWAEAQQPGPAPIVVSGGAGESIRVKQGGQDRVVSPSSSRRIGSARSSSSSSAFDVPEPAADPYEEPAADPYDEEGAASYEEEGAVIGASANGGRPQVEGPFARGYSSSSQLNERMGHGPLVVDRTGGYQPSSRLNEALPGQGNQPFAQGYQPSSGLSNRMVTGALNTTSAWGVGDVTDARAVDQWSDRGSQSRGDGQ